MKLSVDGLNFSATSKPLKISLLFLVHISDGDAVLSRLHSEMLVSPSKWGDMWREELQLRATMCSEEWFVGLS